MSYVSLVFSSLNNQDPITDESPKSFEEFRLLPIAGTRKMNNGGCKPGRSGVLTGTAEKNEIEA